MDLNEAGNFGIIGGILLTDWIIIEFSTVYRIMVERYSDWPVHEIFTIDGIILTFVSGLD